LEDYIKAVHEELKALHEELEAVQRCDMKTRLEDRIKAVHEELEAVEQVATQLGVSKLLISTDLEGLRVLQ
jgi:aminoglycoside phosphotransferase